MAKAEIVRTMHVLTIAVGLLATAAPADTMQHCAAARKAKLPVAMFAGSYEAWYAKCLARDYIVAATVPSAAPEGAAAVCKDGTSIMSRMRSGACSHHGGVAKRL